MKKICVFTSAGDRERFASYATKELIDRCDVVVNYYGLNEEKSLNLRGLASNFSSLKTSKFIALKAVYDSMIRNKYEWVAVFDDDALFLEGSMFDLVEEGDRFGLDLVSGCHKGKVSHDIHYRQEGSHTMRYVNFVEMNFPVFRNKALARYMDAYDGELCGWGNDWWYCNVLKTKTEMNTGIVERVIIENPDGNGEMESLMNWDLREQQWKDTMLRLGLEEWEPETITLA